jgi:hypothetical protein
MHRGKEYPPPITRVHNAHMAWDTWAVRQSFQQGQGPTLGSLKNSALIPRKEAIHWARGWWHGVGGEGL